MSPSRTVIVTDTGVNTTETLRGAAYAIRIITATVFTTLTGVTGSVAGVTFPPDFLLEGNFTEITLASGSVILYIR